MSAVRERLARCWRVKSIVDSKTPFAVPQIWLDGRYGGGADAISQNPGRSDIESNPQRGQNLLTMRSRLNAAG